MAHKKYHYYVVACGTTKGIYDNWERCRMQVECYKGNRYKGFYSLEEAVLFAEQAMDMGEQIAVELCGEKTMEYVGNLDHLNQTA